MEKTKFVVVYDGECPFCRRQIAWIRRRDRKGVFEYVPRQTPGVMERFSTLLKEAFKEGLRVVAPDGRVFIGADAVYEIARRLPRWKVCTGFYKIPVCRQMARVVYRWIAANRYRFSREPCETHCERS